MTAWLSRLWRRLVSGLVSPVHNHPEGAWRYDCPACGLPEWRSKPPSGKGW